MPPGFQVADGTAAAKHKHKLRFKLSESDWASSSSWLDDTTNPFQKPIDNDALFEKRPQRFGLV